LDTMDSLLRATTCVLFASVSVWFHACSNSCDLLVGSVKFCSLESATVFRSCPLDLGFSAIPDSSNIPRRSPQQVHAELLPGRRGVWLQGLDRLCGAKPQRMGTLVLHRRPLPRQCRCRLHLVPLRCLEVTEPIVHLGSASWCLSAVPVCAGVGAAHFIGTASAVIDLPECLCLIATSAEIDSSSLPKYVASPTYGTTFSGSNVRCVPGRNLKLGSRA
jgi:hypothetical protein